jgi:hypothetical protein
MQYNVAAGSGAMNRLLSGSVILIVLALGGLAHASDGDPLVTQAEFAARAHKAEALAERVHRVNTYQDKINKLHMGQGTWERRGPTAYIPELDPNAAGAALALLIGGTFVLVDRRKRLAF